jgi:hypothetical protein
MQGTLAYLNGPEAVRLAEIATSCERSIDVTRDAQTFLRVVLSAVDAAALGWVTDPLERDRNGVLALLVNAGGMVRLESSAIWRESFAQLRERDAPVEVTAEDFYR